MTTTATLTPAAEHAATDSAAAPGRTRRERIARRPRVEATDFAVEIRARRLCRPFEPDDHLSKWAGTLHRIDDEEGGNAPGGPVASIYLATLNTYALAEEGERIYDVLDADSADMERFCALFGCDGMLNEDLAELPQAWDGTVGIINEVWVHPAERRTGLGSLLIDSVTRLLFAGQVHIVACMPEPFEVELDDPDRADARAGVEAFWHRHGFAPYRGSGIWIGELGGG